MIIFDDFSWSLDQHLYGRTICTVAWMVWFQTSWLVLSLDSSVNKLGLYGLHFGEYEETI